MEEVSNFVPAFFKGVVFMLRLRLFFFQGIVKFGCFFNFARLIEMIVLRLALRLLVVFLAIARQWGRMDLALTC